MDDQTLVREGFRKLLELEPDFEVVGTAGDGESAITAMERLAEAQTPPDVVLMDIRMPRMNGIEATRRIKQRWPGAHVVILTTFDDTELIQEGLSAGALGYSLKDITAEQLSMTVRLASSGQVLLQPNIASKVFASFSPATPPTPPAPKEPHAPAPPGPTSPDLAEPLTEREREILTLVGKGASNREIAEALYLTEGTVKNHMTNILNKIGVRDRTQAALKARELGLS
ncbi:MAG TPA: response regulator transcription factor [Chloroflexia bacterium]|nr:response regulator transcription factor [Chloroflexia bacterium]